MSPIALFESFFLFGGGGLTIVANFFIKIIVYLPILLLLFTYFPCHADVMRKERLSLLRAVA
jgi:hypothetical protein